MAHSFDQTEDFVTADDYMDLAECFASEDISNSTYCSRHTSSPEFLSLKSQDELLQSEILSPGFCSVTGVNISRETESKPLTDEIGGEPPEERNRSMENTMKHADYLLRGDQIRQTDVEYRCETSSAAPETDIKDAADFSTTICPTMLHSQFCLASAGGEIDPGVEQVIYQIRNPLFMTVPAYQFQNDSKRGTCLKRKRGEVPRTIVDLTASKI